MLEPSEVVRAWTAGFIDGEGCIEIRKAETVQPSGIYYSYHLEVRVSLTHYPTLLHLRQVWGIGSLHQYKLKPRLEGPQPRKPYFSWVISCNQALAFLKSVLPYMVTKRAEAEVGIAFQQLRRANPPLGGSKPRPLWLTRKYEELMLLSRNLKRPQGLTLATQVDDILHKMEVDRGLLPLFRASACSP